MPRLFFLFFMLGNNNTHFLIWNAKWVPCGNKENNFRELENNTRIAKDFFT